MIWVQFHFLYIFVGRVDRIHKTSHITMLSFYFSPQTSKVLGTSWTVLPKRRPQIFEIIKIEANIWIFQIAFSPWIAPLTKKSFFGLFQDWTPYACEKNFNVVSQAIQVFCKNILDSGQLTCKYDFLVKYLHFHTSTNQKNSSWTKNK